MNREMKLLFVKEWKQAVRNRSAVLSATLFPVLFLLVIPLAQAYMASQGLMVSPVGGVPLPPGLADASPEAMFSQFTFPLFLVLGGLVVPSMAAGYTIVSEREKRTIDLLLALPISLGQIVAAKIAAVVALALAITLPLLLVDFAGLILLGVVEPLLLAGYGLELLASIAFSASSAVAVGLLARDFRTANNLTGAFIGPVILATLGFNLLLPWGLLRLALHAALLLALSVGVLVAALRVVSLERFAL